MALTHTHIHFLRDQTEEVVERMEAIASSALERGKSGSSDSPESDSPESDSSASGSPASASVASASATSVSAWVNITPWFDEEDEHLLWDPPLRKLFSARGAQIPFGTWVPAARNRKGIKPHSLGLTHPQGRYAVRRLEGEGLKLPAGWQVKQDHSRRGIVLLPTLESSCRQMLEYLLDAAVLLADVQLDGRWVADVVESSPKKDKTANHQQ